MISVLVPYRPDGGHRDRSWAWIEKRWRTLFGAPIELLVGGDDGGANPGQFNHPLAINRLAAKAKGEVFIIADADTAFDYDFIVSAVDAVSFDRAWWALPTQYRRLTKESTELAVRLAQFDYDLNKLSTEWVGESVSWSGTVVVPRDGFWAVGGYDERFAFWGADDSSFAAAMSTLWGPVTRIEGACHHFWHPAPLEETYGHERNVEQMALNQRYLDAWGNPEAMTKVRWG